MYHIFSNYNPLVQYPSIMLLQFTEVLSSIKYIPHIKVQFLPLSCSFVQKKLEEIGQNPILSSFFHPGKKSNPGPLPRTTINVCIYTFNTYLTKCSYTTTKQMYQQLYIFTYHTDVFEENQINLIMCTYFSSRLDTKGDRIPSGAIQFSFSLTGYCIVF